MEYFKTSDIVLAATLIYLGFTFVEVERDFQDRKGRRKLWVFQEQNTKTKETATEKKQDYLNKDVIVEPYEFFACIRRAKLHLADSHSRSW